MKKILISLFICFTVSSAQAGFGIKVNPLTALLGLIDADVDFGFNNLKLSANLATWSVDISDFSITYTGVGGTAGYYFSGAFSDSFYIGAQVKSMSFAFDNATEEAEATVTFTGGVLGYQWAWSTFYMNLGFIAGSLSETEINVKNKTSGLETGGTEDVPGAVGTGLDLKMGWYF